MNADPALIRAPSAGSRAEVYAALSGRLAEPRRTIEKAFLDMGERLMACARLLREISSAHESMPAELKGDDFAKAVESMHALREAIGRMSLRHDADETEIGRLATMSDALYDPIDSLNKAVRGLRLISVNARIVAAGLKNHDGDFDSFALEMADHGKHAATIVAEFTASHAHLAATLASAGAANQAFRDRHRDTLAAISGRLAGQLAAIELHKERATTDAVESGRLTKQISARIGDAVSALQVGDITRQRLEHVEDGLRDLESADATTATAALVCRLQFLQLEDAGRDFALQVSAFAGALRDLSSDARLVLEDSAAQSDALLAQGGTALAGLVDDLKAMMLLLREYEAMTTELTTLRSQVAVSVASMRDRMAAIEDLEHSMRLLSLNTAVRCSHLGHEGRALRVIAQEMRELSANTVEAATSVTASLQDAQAMLAALGEAGDEHAEASSLTADAAAAIELLNRVVDRLRQAAGRIADCGPKTAALLQQAAATARGYERYSDGWHSVSEELGRLSGADAVGNGQADTELLARLRRRYTMVSERRIHDEICGVDQSAEVTAPEETACADQALESLLF